MEAVNAQFQVMSDELATLRNEIIAIKTAQAGLHQGAVEAGARTTTIEKRLDEVAKGMDGVAAGAGFAAKGKTLIEAKQIEVPVFAGSIADSRNKFLTWAERFRDRVGLCEPKVVLAMSMAERSTMPITSEESEKMGVTPYWSQQLNGFLKDRTEGTANSIVRSNKSELGLESWRMLGRQFNNRTLQSTLTAKHLEDHPRGANKISEMPSRLLEWERNLRRCVEEGRDPPTDDNKRLALLKMLPAKQRDAIWDTANKLYPTFNELLSKVQEMVQDDLDSKASNAQMDVDALGDETAEWKETGQILTGKGAKGEEVLFTLQEEEMNCV